ncbi:hypothetical protein HYPSUDRAFT_53529 [Hypholoma sublateritium FD-334 SS-4]|uniref:Uncharacterized protein n=1 Tax=Hypholoma sublateritium (strain FD-334 SS-4) TaxID=945553 RepID=A0A0D2LBZ4_HYPSF|nr:hypothetical protein HYPSUDRAFT_53529 [Hypholoma sublateritium FD-334 SS-4]
MSRRSSSKKKGKGKRPPSPTPPTSDVDSDDAIRNQNASSKKPRISSPVMNATASSSKGMAGFTSLVNRSNLNVAKAETNRGLKGGTSGRLSRAGASAKSTLQTDSKGITVGSIVFLVVGIMENPLVSDPRDSLSFHPVYCLQSEVDIPANTITGMKQAGLCKLAALFPKLFEWFVDSEDPHDTAPSWLICMKPPYKKALSVYSDDRSLPSGFDIMRACMMSKQKVGVQDRVLYLVTRTPVPSNVIREWRPKAPSQRVASSGSFEVHGHEDSSAEDTSGGDSSSNEDMPPIPRLLARQKGLQNIAEESEVEREVIDISDNDTDSDQATEPADDINQAAVANSAPVTPPNIIDMNDSFSVSMYIGGDDNPWN